MQIKEAVFIVPIMWNEKYKTHFLFLGKRTKEDKARGKLVPPMGRRESLKFFGKEIPIKESWERRAIKELYQETNGGIRAKNVHHVGDIKDVTFEPDIEWKIRVFASYNPESRRTDEIRCSELEAGSWYGVGLIDYLKENNQLNETTYKALKMVVDTLKDNN